MKRALLLLLVFFITIILPAREKIEKIGEVEWYTEQNSFEDILKIAQAENKSILAVFSATWCAPCKDVKKRVFKNPDFKKVKDKMVLLYIEQTTKEGKIYNKKFKVKGFPTFKIFSKDGILLDASLPSRTVKGFLTWVKEIESGNSYYALLQKIKKDPKDRKPLIDIVGRLGHGNSEEKLIYLKKVLKLNGDFNDPVSQKAYENLLSIIIRGNYFKKGDDLKKFIKSNKELANKIIKSYYPDKFKNNMKGTWGISLLLDWYIDIQDYKNGVQVFKDFLNLKKESINIARDILIFPNAFENLLNAGETELADKWIKEIEDFSKNKEKNKNPKRFLYHHYRCYPSFIEYYGKRNNIKKAEKYAKTFYEVIEKVGNKRFLESRATDYAQKYGICIKETIKIIDEKNKKLSGEIWGRSVIQKVRILNKIDKKESMKILLDLYNNKEYLNSMKLEAKARVLNSLAWSFMEIKSVNKTALKIARESVQLKETPYNMDTLATILSELGQFKEAVKIEKEAVKIMKSADEELKKESLEKIKNWEKGNK